MEKAKKLIRGIAIAAICLNAWFLLHVIGATWAFFTTDSETIARAWIALLVVSVVSLAISCLPVFIVRKNVTKRKIIFSLALSLLAILISVVGIIICLR